MNTVTALLEEYGESHRHPLNKAIHWVCVPLIIFSLLGLLWLMPFPDIRMGILTLNICSLLIIISLIYYLILSWQLAIGMLIYSVLMYGLIFWLAGTTKSFLLICFFVFVVAWIGQFIGHHIEGKRPSFFKDIQFLLIGPIWLLSDLYRRLGIQY